MEIKSDINPNIVSNTNVNTVTKQALLRNLENQVRVDSHKSEVVHPKYSGRVLNTLA